jgi:hypothetical protein
VAGLAKAKLRAAERHGTGLKADANMTLKAALDSYLASRNDLRPASIHAYRMVERTLASWLDWPLRTITPDAVEKRHRELGTKTGGHTANATIRTLRVI